MMSLWCYVFLIWFLSCADTTKLTTIKPKVTNATVQPSNTSSTVQPNSTSVTAKPANQTLPAYLNSTNVTTNPANQTLPAMPNSTNVNTKPSNQSASVQPNTSSTTTSPSFVEKDLIGSLMANYNVRARPTTSNHKAVMINFDMTISKLVKLDMKVQVLVANTRITMTWKDPSLTWSKSDHNGTDILILPCSDIWTPDILLYNAAEPVSKSPADVYKGKIRVSDRGEVNWISAVPIVASCSFNIKYFPLDEQTCTLYFGSISYTNHDVRLKFRNQPESASDIKDSSYISNGNWELVSMTSELNEKEIDCSTCIANFSSIEYTIVWRRLPGYWILYLVFPCICLTLIALCSFFIPAGSGERSGFCITTVLAMSVYLLVISDKLPEKSDQSPLIGVLYTVMFTLMVCILLTTILMVNLVAKKTKPPASLKRLFGPKRSNRISPSATEATLTKKQKEAESDEFEGKAVVDSSAEMACVNRCVGQPDGEPGYPEQWEDIAREIDKRLFWVFGALTIITPSIVLLAFYV